MSKQQILFARLSKFDANTGEFTAIAADETLDKSKEIFDYDTSKPYFQKWGDEFAKNTDGKSVGNVRSMHGKNAAGKLTSMVFDDEKKQIVVTGKIVDDRDALKMDEGVYTGVSIGGGYVRRWDDEAVKGAKRYTADPCEVSLVDNPCNPAARFMRKAKGAEVETEALLTGDPEKAAVDELAKVLDGGKIKPSAVLALIKAAGEQAAKPTAEKRAAALAALAAPELTNGDLEKLAAEHLPGYVAGASEPEAVIACLVKHYEFTEDECKTIEHGSAELTPAQKREQRARAVHACCAKLAPDAELTKAGAALLEKGMYECGTLASLVEQLYWCARSAASEAAYEGDKSILPERLKSLAIEAGEILCEMVEEETQEEANKATAKGDMQKAIAASLEKAGARNSKADQGRLQKIHDHAVDMGADCGSNKAAEGSLSKLFGGKTGDALSDAVRVAIEKAAKFDKMPIRKGVVRAVAREEDGGEPRAPVSKGKEATPEVKAQARKAIDGDLQAHADLLNKGWTHAEIDEMSKP